MERVIELALMEERSSGQRAVVPRGERVRLCAELVTRDRPIDSTLRQEEVAHEHTPVRTDVGATGAATEDVVD